MTSPFSSDSTSFHFTCSSSLPAVIQHLLLSVVHELAPMRLRNPPLPRRDFPHRGSLTQKIGLQLVEQISPLEWMVQLMDDDNSQTQTN